MWHLGLIFNHLRRRLIYLRHFLDGYLLFIRGIHICHLRNLIGKNFLRGCLKFKIRGPYLGDYIMTSATEPRITIKQFQNHFRTLIRNILIRRQDKISGKYFQVHFLNEKKWKLDENQRKVYLFTSPSERERRIKKVIKNNTQIPAI